MELKEAEPLAVLRIGDWRLAVPMKHVERVYSAALPVAVPSSAPGQAMAVRVEDDLIPVAFGASLLGVEELVLMPEHKMVLLASGAGRVVLWVDAVEEVVPYVPLPGRIELPHSEAAWVGGFCGGEQSLAILDPASLRAPA